MTWLVVLMYATWSSVFAFGKVMLAYSTVLFLTGSRMMLAGGILLTYLAIRKRSEFKLDRRQWFSIGILALFSIFLSNILEFWGLQYLSAAKTCFIYSLSPFFAALFSYLHFKEKMTRSKWLGMGIGIIGMIPVFMTQTGSEELLNAFSFFTWPTLAIMGAALFSVYGWVVLRLVVKDHQISPFMANGSSMMIGGTMAIVSSALIDNWSPFPISPGGTSSFISGMLAMTFIYNIVCYNLYGMMLKRYTATFLSFMGLLSPIFASLTAWLLLGEMPSWQIFLSTGIVSIGLWIVYRAELKQGYIKGSSLTSPHRQ
ncbi:MAG: S-adenosylmethionine/S-adenosylhomocysteine transporter [Chlamydiae bacterium]|nr:S-adenosylmethionine/S-adenosylhomocysteine transporter [Chlamydiota bacterium]